MSAACREAADPVRPAVGSFIVCALLVGCQGPVCEAPEEPAFATPTEFLVAEDVAFCNWEVRCGWISCSELATCTDDARARVERYPARPSFLAAAIQQRRSDFDADAARACLAAYQRAGCTADQREEARNACRLVRLLRGRLSPGASCDGDTDCAEGLCTAGGKHVLDDGCPGVCTAYLMTGAACDRGTSLCSQLDYCHPTDKICTRRRGVGEPCMTDRSCQEGLVCPPLPSMKGTADEPYECIRRGGPGERCWQQKRSSPEYPFIDFTTLTTCQPGLYCHQGTHRCTERVGDGVPCAQTSACADGLICNGLRADPEDPTKQLPLHGGGRCATVADLREACDDDEGPGCPWSLACDYRRQCLPTSNLGKPCGEERNWPCPAFSYCDAQRRQCLPQKALGEACPASGPDGKDTCYDGQCSAGRCQLVCS